MSPAPTAAERPELDQPGTNKASGGADEAQEQSFDVGYWSRLRRGRVVPDQTDIDPRSLKRLLSHVFILEASDPSRPIYRLAGTSLCERFGNELRGTNFLAHWESQSRGALCLLLRQALNLKQPICISSVASAGEYGMVELETVLAPVTFGDGAPTRFLGMVQVLSDSAVAGRPIAFERLSARRSSTKTSRSPPSTHHRRRCRPSNRCAAIRARRICAWSSAATSRSPPTWTR